MSKFNEKIRELRLENGFTQKKVAGLLEVSATCYAGYEQGYREPDFKTLIKICKLFDVSSDYLLGLEDDTGTKLYWNIFTDLDYLFRLRRRYGAKVRRKCFGANVRRFLSDSFPFEILMKKRFKRVPLIDARKQTCYNKENKKGGIEQSWTKF